MTIDEYVFEVDNVWVNWFRGETCGLNVCNSAEWKNDDVIEFMTRIAFVRVTETVMDIFESSLSRVPAKLMMATYKKSARRVSGVFHAKVEDAPGVFGVTDGNRVMVIDTDGTEYPVYKSRLSFRVEDVVVETASTYEALPIVEHLIVVERDGRSEYEWYVGLSRIERLLKDVFVYEFEAMKDRAEHTELLYYVTEFNPDGYERYVTWTYEALYEELGRLSRRGYTEAHTRVIKALEEFRGFALSSLNEV